MSDKDELLLTIIARSIGRTIGNENFHARAKDILESIRTDNMTLPEPSRIKIADDIGEALWTSSKDRKLYKSWSDVPQNVRDVWRTSYDNFSEALVRVGFKIIPA